MKGNLNSKNTEMKKIEATIRNQKEMKEIYMKEIDFLERVKDSFLTARFNQTKNSSVGNLGKYFNVKSIFRINVW